MSENNDVHGRYIKQKPTKRPTKQAFTLQSGPTQSKSTQDSS